MFGDGIGSLGLEQAEIEITNGDKSCGISRPQDPARPGIRDAPGSTVVAHFVQCLFSVCSLAAKVPHRRLYQNLACSFFLPSTIGTKSDRSARSDKIHFTF